MGQRHSAVEGRAHHLDQSAASHPRQGNASSPAPQPPPVSSLSAHQLAAHASHSAFDIDRWYPLLSSLTFPTHFLPLPLPTAHALIRFYQTAHLSRPTLTPSDPPLLRSLHRSLASLFASHLSLSRHGAFVRCSARSPKDGTPLTPSTLLHLYSLHLSRLSPSLSTPSPPSSPDLSNLRLIAYTNAQLLSLRCPTPSHALHLLTTSERVFSDLLTAVRAAADADAGSDAGKEGGEGWRTTVSVREWDPHVDPALEFRCFVHRQQLTAISQYDYHCQFPVLQDAAVVTALKLTIARYWADRVRPLLQASYSSYVLDVIVQRGRGGREGGEGEEGQGGWGVRVVELNPFDAATGASLFQWGVDDGVLRGEGWGGGEGEGDVGVVEMRVKTELSRGLEEYVEAVLQEAGLGGVESMGGEGGRVGGGVEGAGGVLGWEEGGPGGDRWEEWLRDVERQAGLTVHAEHDRA